MEPLSEQKAVPRCDQRTNVIPSSSKFHYGRGINAELLIKVTIIALFIFSWIMCPPSLQMRSQRNAWLFHKHLLKRSCFSAKKQVALQPRLKQSIFMIFSRFAPAEARRGAWQRAPTFSRVPAEAGAGAWGAVVVRGQFTSLRCIC